MSLNRPEPYEDEPSVEITFKLQDPEELGCDKPEITVKGRKGDSILGVALDHHIEIEHACGGVVACSTCHVYVNEGEDDLPEAEDDELDRVEEAPGLQMNSRLSCQCRIEGDGPFEIEVPSWNRNAVKETPH
ncbi:MAG: 2Fe-2S iron-sulfur cluster-binding protein [Phycisphaeraceae bacterium]|nr:2Fe-2S iron-sulfur cluster-binding protein [Phycisphaeraceae bacterium]